MSDYDELKAKVAALVDRDFVAFEGNLQCNFRSHSEAYSTINELRRLSGVPQRADMISAQRKGTAK